MAVMLGVSAVASRMDQCQTTIRLGMLAHLAGLDFGRTGMQQQPHGRWRREVLGWLTLWLNAAGL